MTHNGSTQTTGQGSAAPLFTPSRTASTRRNRKRIATLRLVREGSFPAPDGYPEAHIVGGGGKLHEIGG